MIYIFLFWIAGAYLLQLQELKANAKRKHQLKACTNAWHKDVTRYLSIYLFIYVFVVSSCFCSLFLVFVFIIVMVTKCGSVYVGGKSKHKCKQNLKSNDSRDGGMVCREVERLLLLFFIFALTEEKPTGEWSHTPQTMVRPRPEQDLAGWGVAPGRWPGGPATSTATNCHGCGPDGEQGGVWRGGSLPLGRSTGRAWGRGERQSNKGTKAVAGADCWRGVPGQNPSQRQDTKPPKSPLESH